VNYIRDSLGRIFEKTETIQGMATKYDYVYDVKGQLVQVSKNDTIVSIYAYDANGNRLSHWTTSKIDSSSYDAQDRLLSYGNTQYLYSQNGDLKQKIVGTDTTQYDYDAMGNLLSVILPNGSRIEYITDGAGRRIIRKTDGQITHRWLYSDELRISTELDSVGNVLSHFVYATKQNVPDYVAKSGITYLVITDQLGSVRQVVNSATGEVVQQMEYDEYGNVINSSGQQIVPMGFAGGIYDARTKLVRYGARDYDAIVGRWTSKDPLLFGSRTTNHFAYARNNPINLVDPNGTNNLGRTVEAAFSLGVSLGSMITTLLDVCVDAQTNNMGALTRDLTMHILSAAAFGASCANLEASLLNVKTDIDSDPLAELAKLLGFDSQAVTMVGALSAGVSLALGERGIGYTGLRVAVQAATLVAIIIYSSKLFYDYYVKTGLIKE
jgi:RHS repeat-associated protein